MIWREKRVLLIVLGVLLAANTIFFFTYRVRYQARLDELDQRVADSERELRQARAARVRAERSFQSYRQIERDIQAIYDEHWATQPERLTAMISEVKRLAVASSLVPTSYGFDRTEVEVEQAKGRRRKDIPLGATEVGIAFGVDGTYEQVRRLINLLELSQQFVIIDKVGLSKRDGEILSLNLHLKTLFRDEKQGVASNKL